MFANALTLALFAGATIASPSTPRAAADGIVPGDKFGLVSLRSASPIHFAGFQAALNSIFLYLPAQNATCDNGVEAEDATFTLAEDGSLYLYSANGPKQQLYVDRSGMGQGKLGYTTGDQMGPRYSERTKFEVDNYGDVTFNGAGFLACPNSIEDAWSVWVDVGNPEPGFNKGCLGLIARAIKDTETPDSCVYTGAR